MEDRVTALILLVTLGPVHRERVVHLMTAPLVEVALALPEMGEVLEMVLALTLALTPVQLKMKEGPVALEMTLAKVLVPLEMEEDLGMEVIRGTHPLFRVMGLGPPTLRPEAARGVAPREGCLVAQEMIPQGVALPGVPLAEMVRGMGAVPQAMAPPAVGMPMEVEEMVMALVTVQQRLQRVQPLPHQGVAPLRTIRIPLVLVLKVMDLLEMGAGMVAVMGHPAARLPLGVGAAILQAGVGVGVSLLVMVMMEVHLTMVRVQEALP